MGDALAEQGRLHVLGVGVEDVVVAGQAGEQDDVGLGDRPAGGLVRLAHLDVVEEPPRVGHGDGKDNTGPRPASLTRTLRRCYSSAPLANPGVRRRSSCSVSSRGRSIVPRTRSAAPSPG